VEHKPKGILISANDKILRFYNLENFSEVNFGKNNERKITKKFISACRP
jgi:hypothetical protein